MTASAPVFRPGKAWLMALLGLFGGVAYGIAMFKGMTTLLMTLAYFQVDYAFISAVGAPIGLLSIVSGLPAGFLMTKIGPRNLLLLCLGCGIIGSAVPLLVLNATNNYIAFVYSGFLMPFGYGALSVGGPIFVASWFPTQKRGLPNAVAGLFVPIATLIVLLVSMPIATTFGTLDPVTGLYTDGFIPIGWFSVFFLCAAFVAAAIWVRLPEPGQSFLETAAADVRSAEEQAAAKKAGKAAAFRNPGIWMIIIMFFCFGFASMSYASYYPTFLTEAPEIGGGLGIPMEQANLLTTIGSYFMMATSLAFGFFLTRINPSKYGMWMFIAGIGTCFVTVAMFLITSIPGVVVYLIIYGIIQEMFPALYTTMFPTFCDSNDELSVGFGMVATFSNAVGTVGGIILGFTRQFAGSWQAVAVPGAIFAACCLVASIAIFRIWKKRWPIVSARMAAMMAASNPAEAEAPEPAAEA